MKYQVKVMHSAYSGTEYLFDDLTEVTNFVGVVLDCQKEKNDVIISKLEEEA